MKHKFPSAVAASLVLSGCASIGPAERDYMDRESARLGAEPVAVVATGCVVRDEIGGDLILRAASQRSAQALGSALAAELQRRGLETARVVTPLLCPGQLLDASTHSVAEDSDAEARDLRLPLLVDAGLKAEPALTRAYGRIVTEVTEADVALEPRRRALDLSREDADRLRRHLGARDVFVVNAGGTQVSGFKTVTLGVASSLVSIVLSGGTFITTTMWMDGLGYDLALIDLQAREIVWRKQVRGVRGDPEKDGAFASGWKGDYLEPFVDSAWVAQARPAVARQASAGTAPVETTAVVVNASPSAEPAVAAAENESPLAAAMLLAAAMPAAAAPAAAAPAAAMPAVASDAPAIPAPRLLVVRTRPLPTADVVVAVEHGTPIERGGQMQNASGKWCFVKVGGKSGWARAEDL